MLSFCMVKPLHETVATRCTGQPDNALHERSHLSQRLEALGLMVLEGTQLVDHHHVKVKRHPAAFDEPLHILTVDDIQVRFPPECCKPLFPAAENQTVGHVVQRRQGDACLTESAFQ